MYYYLQGKNCSKRKTKVNQGNRLGADSILEEVISKYPALPYPYAERAYNQMINGGYRKTLQDYNTAVQLAPG